MARPAHVMLGFNDDSAAYFDKSIRKDSPVTLFTAFAKYTYTEGWYIEEIDVIAVSERHANEVAAAALLRDYETLPSPEIIQIDAIATRQPITP